MQIKIQNTRPEDVAVIFNLYDDAIAYQKEVGNNHWLGFDADLIKKEIAEDRHFKILADNDIAGTFCITLGDPAIWTDSNETTAVYIHRIATSPKARGNNLLQHIIHWARDFARANNLTCIRMDTGGGNDRLINYYVKNGFTLIGTTKINYTPDLPEHYKDGTFALLQIPV